MINPPGRLVQNHAQVEICTFVMPSPLPHQAWAYLKDKR